MTCCPARYPQAMSLLTLQDAELAFGLHPLLDRASLSVQEGERIGLIGRNGTGKSSLLEVIAGQATLDDGELQRRDGMTVALVEQEPQLPAASSLRESLALRGGLLQRREQMQDEREHWRGEARLVEFLHRFGLDEGASPATASGGERKRAALALAMSLQPDLLLLDEPTNHLDIDGITLLEDLLVRGGTSIVITHDRAFLDRVRNAHRRARPGAVALVSGQLRGLRDPQSRRARRRGRREPQVRQVLGAGRGVDPQGHRGEAHA